MCGYFNDSIWTTDVSDKEILSQFYYAMTKYKDEKLVKIFTSGSFFDDKEIKPKIQEKILTRLFETADKVSVESRPEYLTDKNLKQFNNKKLEVGVGLETADDSIRQNCVNKGFTFNDYQRAAKILKKHNVSLKTYALVKPPFLTEKQSIDDAVLTIKKIKDITDVVSLNPVNVQSNTYVNYLWRHQQYRPPWLFSVVEILKQGKKILGNKRIKCDIAGGGSIRGAHNCKECDKKYLKAISDFSINQDINTFKDLDCICKDKWLDQLDLEDLGFGGLVNIYG